MKKHYRHENDCLNCGTILEGHFCHNCGQENLEMKESFGHMINHAVSDYFHFDYQFFHTLKPLFGKPGKLTVEYLAGRRAQYLHPVKMYIFISLVFFVFFFQGNKRDLIKINTGEKKHTTAHAKDSVKTSKAGGRTKLSAAEKKKITSNLKALVPDTVAKQAAAELNKEAEEEDNSFVIAGNDNSKTYQEYLAKQAKLPEDKRDNWFEKYLNKKNFDWRSHGKNSWEMFQEALRHNFPKLMFVLLPLFALILHIAFWKNRKFYVEHIIYAIHLHCFVFSFLLVRMLIELPFPESWKEVSNWLGLICFLTIIWYVYRSLRTVYGRSRWRTVSKMIGVSLMYIVVFGISFLFLALITAITTV